MGLAPLLLLPLLASLLEADPENCDTRYLVRQPSYLEAHECGFVRIHCFYLHVWELTENPEVKIAWRWKHFHGDFIYNQALNSTHEEFKNRLRLDWTEGRLSGALLIWNLRREDTTTYFCQVTLNTKKCGKRVLQSIEGTQLNVTSAASGDCNTDFGVNQPEHLSAPEGGFVRIPYSFHHSWELAKNSEVKIAWRWKHFHGDFIYNQTPSWTHEEFKDRLYLDWTQGQTRGALLIWNLRRGEATTYFCQVTLQTKNCGPKRFQSIQGTKLIVTPAQPEAGLVVTNSTQSPGPLRLDAVVAVTVTVALLKTTILGLITYLVWKRSQAISSVSS